MIGLVAVTAAGRQAAGELGMAWPGETKLYAGPAAQALPAAFAECTHVVAFLATGVAVRLLASHLGDKHTDPAVVCVDEGRRFAVALLGGHGGGANDLAQRVASTLDAQPVVTTASDAVGIAGIDQLGWPIQGDVAGVARALLDGEPVALQQDARWPLPALPPNVQPVDEVPARDLRPAVGARHRLRVTDRVVAEEAGLAVLRPPSLVLGVGASRGVPASEVLALIDDVLAGADVSAHSVRHLATIDVKADEPGLLQAAGVRGWPLVTHPAEVLATVAVPNPSERVRAEVGTPSVAEAACLVGDATLLVPKTKSAGTPPMATVALARHRPRGRLAVIGLGPGARDLLSPRAHRELRAASVVVGLDQYVDQIRDLLRPGTRVLATGLGSESERARSAVDEARAGQAVALIGSGDAGIYAMASPALEVADTSIDVVGVAGITAAVAAAALLGAPLGHDHAYLSLSDLHTPWEAIERRVRAAAAGDFVVCFYNPRSHTRDWQLSAALDLLAASRPGTTPVGLVRSASRPDESATVTTLDRIRQSRGAEVDMATVVLVGSSQTRLIAGRMVTPRGYRWMP